MNVDEVYRYFGSNWSNVSRELKLGVNTYQGWVKKGYIPMPMQIRIEQLTEGKLKSDLTLQNEKDKDNK